VRRAAALELASIAGLVAAQALLFGRLVGTDTDYDEGVYLTSVDALEHGQRLGEDVFAPQPPGWYLLLRLVSLAGADSVREFHIGMVVIAVATCFAAYVLGRAIAGPLSGLAASAMLTIAPPFPLFAHRVLADIPPLGLALLSFWLAWEARERRSVALAAAAGAALVLAVSVKPNAVLAAPAFLALLLWERSGRRRALVAAASGAVVVACAFLLAYRDVLPELWASVVTYHRNARDTPAVIDKTHELVTFLNWRTPFAWLVVAGLAASLLLLRRRQLDADWALWLWAAISIAFLVLHHPLHYNHLLTLAVVLAVPAGIALALLVRRTPRPQLGVAVIAVVLVAGYAQQQRRIVHDDIPEEANLVAAAKLLARETRPDELVVSDHSIVPFLADRRVAGPLVDTARLRFQTGSLTDEKVIRALERYSVRAVVAGRAFADRPALTRLLEQRYGAPRRVDDDLVVFLDRTSP
jgi:4-amino-4-deoxy-L-arabinose transferase-like glycosyltransferase